MYLSLYAMVQRTPDRFAMQLFIDEVCKLESARTIPAMKQFLIEGKVPSVADIHKRCGINVQYGPEIKPTQPEPKPQINPLEKHKDAHELMVRIEAPFPWCSDLTDSAKHWRSKVESLICEGWQVVTWEEMEGERLMEKGVDGRLETSKQRIYYANALISKRPNAIMVTCKTHIKGQYRPVAMDNSHNCD